MPLPPEAKLKKQYPGTSVVFIENRANGAAAISTKRALIAAGYSDAQARKGIAAIRSRTGLCQALVEEGRRWTPEAREALVRGRLI